MWLPYLSSLSTPAPHFLILQDKGWYTETKVLQTPPETWKSKNILFAHNKTSATRTRWFWETQLPSVGYQNLKLSEAIGIPFLYKKLSQNVFIQEQWAEGRVLDWWDQPHHRLLVIQFASSASWNKTYFLARAQFFLYGRKYFRLLSPSSSSSSFQICMRRYLLLHVLLDDLLGFAWIKRHFSN